MKLLKTSQIFKGFVHAVQNGFIILQLTTTPSINLQCWPPRIVLTASVQRTVVNELKGTINLKSLCPGQKFWFKHQRHLSVKYGCYNVECVKNRECTRQRTQTWKHILYSCFASLTLTMCKAGDIFAKYETQFGASISEGPPRQLLCVGNSTQIYGNHATGPVNCRSRRRVARTDKEARAL